MVGSGQATAAAERVRAVVCDDSPFMRRLIADSLGACGVDVVGQVGDGAAALVACAELRPDVLTLDLQMPGLSGMEVLQRLPPGGPGVIVVSAYTEAGSALAVEALSTGAVEVIRKPTAATPLDRFASDLNTSVRAAAASRRGGNRRHASLILGASAEAPRASPTLPPTAPLDRAPPNSWPSTPVATPRLQRPLVVIATSTGGPRALAELVPLLPNPCGSGVVIVQHMPPGFTKSLAARLDRASKLAVREATDGERIDPSAALIAPGGSHLRIRGDVVELSDDPAIGGLRPRADVTIEDAARDWGDRCVLVVLTGMGSDGTIGARALKAAGGIVLTEAEETCVVYGMPRSIEEAGLSDIVRPLDALPSALAGVLRP